MFLLGSMSRSRSQCEQSDFFFFFFWELAISFLCFWPTNFLPDAQTKWCFCLVRWFDHVHNVSNQIFFFFFFWELAISFPCFWPTNFCLTHPNKLQQKSKRKRKSHKHTSGPSSWRIDESHLCIYLSFLTTEKFIVENLVIEWGIVWFPYSRENLCSKLPTCPKKKEKKREIYHLLN